ncbi:hypothetical protein DesyoDRAFT_1095 [Desulfosporosinus youngiae DSM 17734]|uniref:Uncharacterized protein n=1 Tax=Desulfosporosinus youngiae DSM 17734 TaxID=768710 RepID=H5Y267_9FIRM|nr:hypothetical protein DesyoDRAFT_1095 [Desulfosporosinus youngiae DSM 17734]
MVRHYNYYLYPIHARLYLPTFDFINENGISSMIMLYTQCEGISITKGNSVDSTSEGVAQHETIKIFIGSPKDSTCPIGINPGNHKQLSAPNLHYRLPV